MDRYHEARKQQGGTMRKFVIALSITALTVSAYAMSKTPADTKGCCADKPAAVKSACPACTAAGGMCTACKAKADATKAACTADKAAKDAGCASGVCPLKK
jgi:hypothetical protein